MVGKSVAYLVSSLSSSYVLCDRKFHVNLLSINVITQALIFSMNFFIFIAPFMICGQGRWLVWGAILDIASMSLFLIIFWLVFLAFSLSQILHFSDIDYWGSW